MEMTVVRSLGIVDRIEEEALRMGYGGDNCLKLCLLQDRGFLKLKEELEACSWSAIELTIHEPTHKNKPQPRGRKPRDYEAPEKRKFFPHEEVDYNRAAAGEMWVNEWSVGALKRARLFHRKLDLSTFHSIWDYFCIAAALVNYHLDIEPLF